MDKNGEKYLSLRANPANTGTSRGGILHPLVEIDSALCPVKYPIGWETAASHSGLEPTSAYGGNLRIRLSVVLQLDATANGVFDRRIDTHSLRSGELRLSIPRASLWMPSNVGGGGNRLHPTNSFVLAILRIIIYRLPLGTRLAC